jgi:hypothetical protein
MKIIREIVQSGRKVALFQRNILPHSCSTLKMGAAGSSVTLVTIYQIMQCYIAEDSFFIFTAVEMLKCHKTRCKLPRKPGAIYGDYYFKLGTCKRIEPRGKKRKQLY